MTEVICLNFIWNDYINALDRDHPDLQLKISRYVADEEFSAIQVKIRKIVGIVRISTEP